MAGCQVLNKFLNKFYDFFPKVTNGTIQVPNAQLYSSSYVLVDILFVGVLSYTVSVRNQASISFSYPKFGTRPHPFSKSFSAHSLKS